MSKTLSGNFESCNNNNKDVGMQQENSIIDYYIMAIPVVEFSREGYKIRKVFD